jgi:hypothetical protein
VENVLRRVSHGDVVDVHALETLVATLACDAWPVDPVAAELGDRIRRDALPLRQIAVAMGWSERDLRRRSRSAMVRRRSRGSSASTVRSGWHADRRAASPSWPSPPDTQISRT